MTIDMNWNYFIDENELASLMPGSYCRYARPVKEALAIFLGGLPEKDQQQVLLHQAELGPLATLPERLGRLALDCPVLHKLAQTLARDPRLGPKLREQLHPLESLPPRVPLQAIKRRLRQELGPLNARGVTLGEHAIAEASVAVVIPFVDQGASVVRRGVFKILKPGIEERLHHEIELLPRIGAHLDDCCHRLKIPQVDYEAIFDQVREKLSWEIRLDQEQLHLSAARNNYAQDPAVLIPALFDHCTPRVTAMERVFGWKITELPAHVATSQRAIAKQIIRTLISQPFFSSDDAALFHADPHAGNLMVTVDGRLALLDWSLAGSLAPESRAAVMQLLPAAVTLDGAKIVAVLSGLAASGIVDEVALTNIVNRRLQRLCRGELPGLTWLVGLFDEAVQSAGLRVSADLMLFRKSLITLEHLVSDLSADDVRLDDVLFVDFVRRFAAEWPRRLFQCLHSRTSPTRITNAELVSLVLSLPTSAVRWWLGELCRHPFQCNLFDRQPGTPIVASVP